jgi:phage-related holin
MSKEHYMFTTAGTVIVPVFEFFYGVGEVVFTSMIALIVFIILDWISGISAARKDNSYGSSYGIDGIGRTLFMLLLPAGGHMLDEVFNMPAIIFGTLTAGLLYHVMQSMIANALRAGWATWLPINVLKTLLSWVGSEMDKKSQRAVDRGGEIPTSPPAPKPDTTDEAEEKQHGA